MSDDKNKINQKLREFKLTSLAVDNGTSIFILTAMILLFGFISYKQMPKEQFPEIEWPQVFVNTIYFGNSASDIENLVTRPLEKEIQQVDGIKDVFSTSMQDYSVIIAEFDSEVDLDIATRKVKDAVDKAQSELPNDLTEDPIVEDIDFSEFPIMTINLSGDFNNDELRNYAEYLEEELEDLRQVSEVEIKGSLEREVKIDVDLLKMEARQVSFQDIENAVRGENITMSGGELVKNDFRRAIRVVGEFENVDQMKNIIIKSEDLQPIYLRDIADVTFGYKERSSYARSDGYPVVSLDIIKRSGENLLEAADMIKVVLAEAEENVLPDNLKTQIFNDQSIYTRNEVKNLENSIISGVILVVVVLLFFLGFRNATFVGMAIPLSMLMGILLLHMTGNTMNMIVLFSLILALGLLVDNAIVVVENIYRYMDEGYPPLKAAKYGTGEVAMPIIASTATTLAAFLPLAFWPGIMGSFMQYLPITLILVLTSSLFVALVINPVFTSRLMSVGVVQDKAYVKRGTKTTLKWAVAFLIIGILGQLAGMDWLRNLMGFSILFILLNFFVLRPASNFFQSSVIPFMEFWYNRFIKFALKIPILIFCGTVLLLILSIVLLGIRSPKVEFFPIGDPIYVNAFVEMPLGTDIEATNRIANELEYKISDAIKQYGGVVEAVLTQIGENTADPNGPPDPGASPHKARLTASFVPSDERGKVDTKDIMRDIREAVKGYAGVEITVDQNADGPPTGKPINLEISGEDINQLTQLSEEIRAYINSLGIPGIEELKMDVKLGKPEMLVHVNREAARRFGISTYQIADALRTSVFGKEISKFKSGEDEYDIFVRLKDEYRYNVSNLLNQKITFRSPASGQLIQVPVTAVADVEFTSTYNSIKRKNLDRVITIYSNLVDGYNANEIVAEIGEALGDFDMPTGYSYEFTGEQEQQAEDLQFLLVAFAIAVFAIFIIIVGQFNSLSAPFIIILSVLFSTIGVFLGYVVNGNDIVIVMTGVGLISLAGVVVNNAIVLLDYTILTIRRRQEELGVESMFALGWEELKQCIVKSGATRLRPVLLTAITTVLGLIPLAIGFNFNFFTFISELDGHLFIGGDNVVFWGPMAWTVIYGLVFATFLTLIVVPSMYYLALKLKWTTFSKKKKAAILEQR
jgi:multidrug efflux pump subunit AcrB